MRILFVHPGFPAQFRHVAQALVQQGHAVRALCQKPPEGAAPEFDVPGVQVHAYGLPRGGTPGAQGWVAELELRAIRGEAALQAALALRDEQGFAPHVMLAHAGLGDSLFLKAVWPGARLGLWGAHYHDAASARHADPDPGLSPLQALDAAARARAEALVQAQLRMRNAQLDLYLREADGLLVPTDWQAARFPAPWRERLWVAHDGIDTEALAPNAQVRATLPGDVALAPGDEVVSFVARSLEPRRGLQVVMRALPRLLAQRPAARVLIVGAEGPGQGPLPADGRSWKQHLIDEVLPQMPEADWQRVHFLGPLPHAHVVAVLQLAAVHVHWAYPLALSRSLLEAMSTGCAVVAGDTAPVREVLADGETGRLLEFFDAEALADEVARLLQAPAERQRLGAQARQCVQARYDLHGVCLPRQLQWLQALADGAAAPAPAPTPDAAQALRAELARAEQARDQAQQAAALAQAQLEQAGRARDSAEAGRQAADALLQEAVQALAGVRQLLEAEAEAMEAAPPLV